MRREIGYSSVGQRSMGRLQVKVPQKDSREGWKDWRKGSDFVLVIICKQLDRIYFHILTLRGHTSPIPAPGSAAIK